MYKDFQKPHLFLQLDIYVTNLIVAVTPQKGGIFSPRTKPSLL